MNGQTPMGLAAAAAAAVRPCRRRLLSSASAAAAAMTATATPLFPRCPHPHHHPRGRRLPFLASAASQTSQSGPITNPTPIPADPRAAVAGNLPFFDRVLFPDTLPRETPPVEEEAAPPADEGLASAAAAREETDTDGAGGVVAMASKRRG